MDTGKTETLRTGWYRVAPFLLRRCGVANHQFLRNVAQEWYANA
jgi:hypothetical protein